jgi:hypothetical protein
VPRRSAARWTSSAEGGLLVAYLPAFAVVISEAMTRQATLRDPVAAGHQ